MGKLAAIPFEQESDAIKDRVTSYWTKRAGSFSEMKHHEAHSGKAELWIRELTPLLPKHKGTAILDVGCGAGFFELLLEPLGYRMTGIDLTPDMISQAEELARRHHAEDARFLVMDAEHPDFADASFDAVISRNLTWTLPHPVEAYREWYRILKPGGILLNYDAEYAKGFHTFDQKENRAHSEIDNALIEECHDIYHMLSVSSLQRPAWDLEVLQEIGFREAEADLSVGDRLYGEKDQFYMPDRMFGIRAVK